jgi:hypothetical protein
MAEIGAMRLRIAILVMAGSFGGLWSPVAAAPEQTAAQAVADPVPLPRARPRLPQVWAEPRTFREAAGPDFKSEEVTSEPSACRQRLEALAVIASIPRLIGPGGCGGGDLVELSAVRMAGNTQIAIKPAPILRCAMAESLASWVRDEAAPRIAKTGALLRQLDTYDDYSCRGRNRIIGAQMSEHGKGNAVDIRSFSFTDGRVVMPTDVKVSKDLRAGLRESACARFTTVLGPGSDGYHEEHIHLDLAERRSGFRMCQWDVREPPPPPLPKAEEIAAAEEMAGKPTPMPLDPHTSARAGRGRMKM